MTWQTYLEKLNLTFIDWAKLSDKAGDGFSDATELMKEKYPGNYQVIEKYDSVRGNFVFKLEFSDSHEETIWLLKNS